MLTSIIHIDQLLFLLVDNKGILVFINDHFIIISVRGKTQMSYFVFLMIFNLVLFPSLILFGKD